MKSDVTNLEEDARTNEYHFGRRKCLPDRDQNEIDDRSTDIHQANPFAKCLRKRLQDVDRRAKPSVQSLVAAPGLAELFDLFLKYDQDCCGRVALSEFGCERVSGEILFSLFLIQLFGLFEDDLEIG